MTNFLGRTLPFQMHRKLVSCAGPTVTEIFLPPRHTRRRGAKSLCTSVHSLHGATLLFLFGRLRRRSYRTGRACEPIFSLGSTPPPVYYQLRRDKGKKNILGAHMFGRGTTNVVAPAVDHPSVVLRCSRVGDCVGVWSVLLPSVVTCLPDKYNVIGVWGDLRCWWLRFERSYQFCYTQSCFRAFARILRSGKKIQTRREEWFWIS